MSDTELAALKEQLANATRRLDDAEARISVLTGAFSGALSQLNPTVQVVASRHARTAAILYSRAADRARREEIFRELFQDDLSP